MVKRSPKSASSSRKPARMGEGVVLRAGEVLWRARDVEELVVEPAGQSGGCEHRWSVLQAIP